jgi:GNAT superfamily N-acetyltransferase
MIDMLVRLYALPPYERLLKQIEANGFVVRRPRAYEKELILSWVKKTFSQGWADECEVCFSRTPVSVHIATFEGEIAGFSCHEATYKDFFGPIGVVEKFRKQGLGKALLLSSLTAMHDLGYAYAIIGGPTVAVNFYRDTVGAVPIEGSSPGIYVDRLKGSDS